MSDYVEVTEDDLQGPVFLVTGRGSQLHWKLVNADGGALADTEYEAREALRSWGDAIRSLEKAALALGVREGSIVDARMRPWLQVRHRVFS